LAGLWLVMVLIACAVSASIAAEPAAPREQLTDWITVGGKQVPLPRGVWEVAAAGTQTFDRPDFGAYGAIENVILFRRDGNRVLAVAEINANAVPIDNGWGWAPSCERATQFLLVTRYRSGWDLSCTVVQPTYAPAGGPGPRIWREALRQAAVSGLSLPSLWLTAAFRISDRQDVIDVRYHFAPDTLIGRLGGRANNPPDWSPSSVGGDRDRIAAVRLLSSWAVGADEAIERGMRNQLSGTALDTPRRAAFFSNTPRIDAKLRDLEALYGEGNLSADEFVEQQNGALAEVPVLPDDRDWLSRTIERSLSLRAVNSLIDYGLGVVIAVSAPVTGWLAAPVVIAYSTVFVLNDQLWERRWTPPANDTARAVEFVHLGSPA
jgi:hypothetical protein